MEKTTALILIAAAATFVQAKGAEDSLYDWGRVQVLQPDRQVVAEIGGRIPTRGHIYHSKVKASVLFPLSSVTGSTSTFVGGIRTITPKSIAVDDDGNTYIAGNLVSKINPTLSTTDVFLTKLNSVFQEVYTIYFGGNRTDRVSDMAIGPGGDVYLVGKTNSDNFPTVNARHLELSGGSDGFLCRLTASGGFVYSTLIGGSSSDGVRAVAVDAQGDAYLTGHTSSRDFPVTEGAFQTTADYLAGRFPFPTDSFVTKVSADGQELIYSTLLGGRRTSCSGGSSCIPAVSNDVGTAIALDLSGNVYVAGSTNSYDFPTTLDAFQTECHCRCRSPSGFVTKFNSDGTSLVFSTFLADRRTSPTAIAVDAFGHVTLTGHTTSPNFPVTEGALQTNGNPVTEQNPATFVTKLDSRGASLVFSTFLTSRGGPGRPIRIVTDPEGNTYVTGVWASHNFPVSSDGVRLGSGFFLKLNPEGSQAIHSTLLPEGSIGTDLALSTQGDIYLLGDSGLVSRVRGDTFDLPPIVGFTNAAGFRVTRWVAPWELVSVYGNEIGPVEPTGLQFDSDGNVSTVLSGTQLLFNGIPAPLTFVGRHQISAIATLGSARPGHSINMTVLRDDRVIAQMDLIAAAAVPGVFRRNGSAAALNQDGTVNSRENRAKTGSIISIFATGLGAMDLVSGKPWQEISIHADADPLEILFVGQAPGLVTGVIQINFRLSAVHYRQGVLHSLSVGGRQGNFRVYVAP